MDPNFIDEDDDAEAQAMAAAMGFSGFGKKGHPAKKRKFNPTSDAYVEGDELTKLDKGGKKGQGSGGNTIPLGKSRLFGAAALKAEDVAVEKEMGNRDEIDLEDQDEDTGPNYIDTSLPPPAEHNRPPYIDTSQPLEVSEAEAMEMQARIDALLAQIQPGETGDSSTAPPASILQQLPQRPAGADTAFMQGGPRPGPFSNLASVASSSRLSHSGQRNEFWYVDYYDPSFNENPWERLEKSKGLESLGTWPENTRHQKHH